jgi:hypothetical protein
LILYECENKPNSRQLGFAHFSVGLSRKYRKQLWRVPTGKGKSRIMAFICLIALTTGMYSKVYLVFDNQHLMKKDKADFERLWVSSGLTENIQYCVGYGF